MHVLSYLKENHIFINTTIECTRYGGIFSTHPLVLGFRVQTSLHSFHPQLLLGRVHVEESFSAQVQLLKTKVINQVTILVVI